MRHEQEGDAADKGAGKKIGSSPTPSGVPGMIAHIADDRLDDEPRERSRQEKQGDGVGFCVEVFIDGPHIGPLEIPAKLDAEETYAHVQDLDKTQRGLFRE